MQSREILERAVTKAIEGGWNAELDGTTLRKIGKDGSPYAWIGVSTWTSRDLIFSHEFAKALWGDKNEVINFYSNPDNTGDVIDFRLPAWRRHLIYMVLSEDPVKYLGENI